jgi:rhodanese-related sulfurtransferase
MFLLVLLLAGCKQSEDLPTIKSDSFITMLNLDDYLFRDDVQYVDLRNYSSWYNAGYIEGFEQIPFFDYLDYRVFDRDDSFDFQPDQLIDASELERLFDRDKAIFLYADGCIRSGYVAEALLHLGYERVFVLGGFYEYTGDHLVLGTGDYRIGDTFYRSYTSPTTDITYLMYGEFNMGRKILTIRFDLLDSEGETMRATGYDPVINYDQQLTTLEEFIVSDLVTFNALYERMNDPSSSGYDSIDGYDLGFSEDFLALIETLVINP